MALKVIKIVGYMGTARFPYGFSSFPEILPLPPFSTISGMVHFACGWECYHSLNFFVSGKGFLNQEIQQMWQGGYKFSKITEEQKKRWDVICENGDSGYQGWVRSPKKINFLSDLNLEIYIQPQDEDFQKVFDALKHPKTFLTLGRHEDLLRVDDVEIVELQQKNEIGTLKNAAYVPDFFVSDDLCSISYNINKKYDYTNKGFRRFEKIRCRYIDKGTKLFCNLFDNDNPVFLA